MAFSAKKVKTIKYPGEGVDLWVVEASTFGLPKVSKHKMVELRPSGVMVRFRDGTKFIGPALCRRWYTDRAKMEYYLRREIEGQLSSALARAKDAAAALARLPSVEVHVVPPATRDQFDDRSELI